MAWKEIRTPLFRRGGVVDTIVGIVGVIVLLITYAYAIANGYMDERTVHVVYVIIFAMVGTLFSAVLSATAITSEKEARSWPILLATPLGDTHILLGKALGIFRRCLPIWGVLAAHVIVFTLVGYIHPIALFHLAILAAWVCIFLTGSGLYFSSCFKRTTVAVAMNLGLGFAVWILIPIVLSLLSIGSGSEALLEECISFNPAAQAFVLMEGAGGEHEASQPLSSLDYDWPDSLGDGVGPTTVRMVLYLMVYGTVGVVFAWRAKRRFRKSIF